jgi:hypothetical protein
VDADQHSPPVDEDQLAGVSTPGLPSGAPKLILLG